MNTPISRIRLSLRIILLGVCIASSATAQALPPRAQVQDLKSIAGEWDTVLKFSGGSVSGTDSIREDGSDAWIQGSEKGTIFLKVVDNVIRWESRSGRTGTVVLHEGDGRRVLIWTYDWAPDWSGQSVPKPHYEDAA
jgi:hypothetical protein